VIYPRGGPKVLEMDCSHVGRQTGPPRPEEGSTHFSRCPTGLLFVCSLAILVCGLFRSPISINSASEYEWFGSMDVTLPSGIEWLVQAEAALGSLAIPEHCDMAFS
jgi:hypothetical protein